MNTIIPRMSEKAFKVSQELNTYVFTIPAGMNRAQVAEAVKEQYGVEVVSVKIAVIKGKAVRFVRKGGRVNKGVRANTKKAFVRIASGQSLPIFAAIEEEIKEADKGEKAEAKVEAPKKRGLFNRKSEKAPKMTGATQQVTRTQAKVGEK